MLLTLGGLQSFQSDSNGALLLVLSRLVSLLAPKWRWSLYVSSSFSAVRLLEGVADGSCHENGWLFMLPILVFPVVAYLSG